MVTRWALSLRRISLNCSVANAPRRYAQLARMDPPAPSQPQAQPQAQGTAKKDKDQKKDQKKKDKQAKFELKKAQAAAAAAAGPAAPPKDKAKEKPKIEREKVAAADYVEDTPAGEKKRIRSFDDPFFKAYNPVAVESAWSEWWEREGFFQPELTKEGKIKDEGSFVIVLPPPNITGNLHMGHALGNALQDIMIRWNRMHGKTTLWLPGCDHSSISTQSVVENMLWRRQGKTRHDLGRPKFIETVWEWKEEYHQKINSVQKKMGGSFDWTREAFTMDKNLSDAVVETFVTLHEEGIIYRANRLVNWCTKLNTTLSNLEVVNKELPGRTLLEVPGYERKVEFGVMVHFKYRIDGSDETIEVATTRPETILGDTGIAVHPSDDRYKHLVASGAKAVHPFIEGRLLPIVADGIVEKDFGTGAVKITPAHDFNDFAIGQRQGLETINILTDDGLMNANAGPYQGQRRFDVRYAIQEDLKKLGLFVEKKDHPMTVPLCDKSKDVIEPLLKPQWWMRMRGLADEAVKAVRDGRITIKPETAEKSYFRWMDDINDWCISRQLWWGHQAPVYFARIEGQENDHGDESRWFSGRTEAEARAKATKALSTDAFVLEQDPDVLDTWFSSGLWPFATLGWPNASSDMKNFYPTAVLETGWDILFFWIARMIMLGLKLTGDVPFREVYCHPLVRDSEGRKMSKSLGNVIDPWDVINGATLESLHTKLLAGNLPPTEVAKAKKYQSTAFPRGIPECGVDALRFCLASYTGGGSDINFDINVMHSYRRFCNKIYQAVKYVLGKLDADFAPRENAKLSGNESLAERWLLHKMNLTAKKMNEAIAEREFMKSTLVIYQYFYGNLCDTFIENSKAIIQYGSEQEKRSAMDTLYTAIESGLTMIHPFMPFLTEELWQRLPRRAGDDTPSIVIAKYPTYDPSLEDTEAEAAYELVMACAREVRSMVASYALSGDAQIFIQGHGSEPFKTISEQMQSIKSLAGKNVNLARVLSPEEARPSGCVASTVSSSATVFLLVKGHVDIDDEIAKNTAKLEKARAAVERQTKVLAVPDYSQKVSREVQEADRKKLADLEMEADALVETVRQFEQIKLKE